MSAAFTAGQTVYDRSGRVFEFAGMMGDSAIVHPMYEASGWEGETETYPSELAERKALHEISAKPPTQAINADVSLASEKLAELNASIAAAAANLRETERSHKARMETLKRYSALSRIEDFIEGRMTHFVCRTQYGRGVEVKTFDEMMKAKDDYGRFNGDIKLLSLFGVCGSYAGHGNIKKDLLWRVNHYYDGSGSGSHQVQPCISEDEAKGIAANWLDGIWVEHRGLTDRATRWHWLKDAIDSAKSLGFAVPADIQKDFDEGKERAARVAVEKAEAELAKARIAAGGIA